MSATMLFGTISSTTLHISSVVYLITSVIKVNDNQNYKNNYDGAYIEI